MKSALLLTFAFFCFPAVAQESKGDPVNGQKVAKQRCAECHDVTGNAVPRSPPGNAPPFVTLANSEKQTQAKIRGYVRLPHGRMVNLIVFGKDAEDVASYIMSLR